MTSCCFDTPILDYTCRPCDELFKPLKKWRVKFRRQGKEYTRIVPAINLEAAIKTVKEDPYPYVTEWKDIKDERTGFDFEVRIEHEDKDTRTAVLRAKRFVSNGGWIILDNTSQPIIYYDEKKGEIMLNYNQRTLAK